MLNSEASCLCGAVKIIANEINSKFTVCHCDSCRGWGGAPFFAVQCGTNINIEDNEFSALLDQAILVVLLRPYNPLLGLIFLKLSAKEILAVFITY